MAIDKIEKDHFIYITYNRQSFKDIEQFRTTLSGLPGGIDSEKDIVIDFGTTKYLTSPEIGSIVRLATGAKGSLRAVRLIPDGALHKQLSSLNLIKMEHLTIYKNRQDFADQLKSAKDLP